MNTPTGGITIYDYAEATPIAVQYPTITYATMPGPFDPSVVVDTRQLPPDPTNPDPISPDPAANRVTQLHLSVTTPIDAQPNQDLPVVVFIHGGSYNFGDRSESWFDGRRFAKSGIILVTCDYRLGGTGFIRFGSEQPNHYRGIDDCHNALLWVQQNIEAYGGDPTNVTLTGQSAGGGIVLWLARKDHYQGLFRRLWALSPAYPRKSIEQGSRSLRMLLQVPLTRKHLNKLAMQKPHRYAKRWRRFMRLHPSDMVAGPCPFAAEELVDIPMILSCTDKELDEMELPRLAHAYVPRWVRHRINQRWGAAFSFNTQTSGKKWLLGLINNVMIRRYVTQAAQIQPKNWTVYFTETTHCSELGPFFDSVAVLPEDEQWIERNPHQAAVRFTHQLIVDFAHNITPSWPQSTEDELASMVINIKDGTHQVDATVLAEVVRDFPPYCAETSRSAWTNPS